MQKRIISMLLSVMMVLGVFSCLPEKTATIVSAATSTQENIVKRANSLYVCKWTSKKSIYSWKSNSVFSEGGTYRIPYGQPVSAGAYVGYGVTPAGFMRATLDASNVFYTSRSYYSGNSGSYAPYYATDCSAYVSYCWELSARHTTATLPGVSTSLGLATSANVDKIQIGDALNLSSSHVVLVTSVTYSGSTLSSIQITEQTPPQLKRSTYTRDGLIAKYSSYTILRYNGTVTAPTFKVRYFANNGSGTMDDQTITYEESTTLSANKFTRAGYTFKGWKAYRNCSDLWLYSNSDGDKNWYAKGSQPDGYSIHKYKDGATVSKVGYGVGDLVKLYATWEKDSGADGTVIFQYDANGGEGTMDNQTITYGTETTLSANQFTREGYTFQGWWPYRAGDIQKYRYTNGGDTADDKGWYTEAEAKDLAGYYPYLYEDKATVSKVGKGTGDTVIMYAMWGSVNYEVLYDANGGSGTMANSKHMRGIPTCLTKNAFTKADHTFAGWYIYKPSKGTYLYSQYKGKDASWFKPGEQPAGWRLALYKDQKVVSTLTKTEGTVVHCIAQWTPNTTGTTTYYVDFNANGGTGTMKRQTVVKGTETNLRTNTFTYEDHNFLGWYVHRRSDNMWKTVDASGNAVWLAATDVTDDTEFKLHKDSATVHSTSSVDTDIVTCYAVWELVKNFTLKYMPNGGTGTMADQKVYWGVQSTLNTNQFTRTGYTFAGWNAYRVEDNEWRFTNGTDQGWYVEGQQPEGYTKFVYTDGHTISKTGTGNSDTVNMYAVWNVNTYKIAYDANGGTGSMSGAEVLYDSTVNLDSNTFTKACNDFAGWTAKRSSDGFVYCVNKTNSADTQWKAESAMGSTYEKYVFTEGATVRNLTGVKDDTVTMSAVWEPYTYKIQYNANGGTGTMSDITVNYGDTFKLTANAYKIGNSKFAGWTAQRASDGYVYCVKKTDSTDKKWMAESAMGVAYQKYLFTDSQSVGDLTTIDGDTVTFTAQWKLCGDANGDNRLSISDVTRIQEVLVGIVDYDIPKDTCDLDGDGEITIRDASYIQLYLTKSITVFPICK